MSTKYEGVGVWLTVHAAYAGWPCKREQQHCKAGENCTEPKKRNGTILSLHGRSKCDTQYCSTLPLLNLAPSLLPTEQTQFLAKLWLWGFLPVNILLVVYMYTHPRDGQNVSGIIPMKPCMHGQGTGRDWEGRRRGERAQQGCEKVGLPASNLALLKSLALWSRAMVRG